MAEGKLPVDVRSSFSGRVGVRFGKTRTRVDFYVEDGIVRSSLPALKGFKDRPLSEVEDWYNRHPDVEYQCRRSDAWTASVTY
jgi:hypothetical protein